MVLSQNIANLLSKQISTLAVAQEVFGYGTEPEHRKFASKQISTPAVAPRGVRIWY